jgi:F-type H+-transporting ATPase subunit c
MLSLTVASNFGAKKEPHMNTEMSAIAANVQFAKVFAAAIAALPLAAVAFAVGKIFTTLIDSIARNPSVRDKVYNIGILGFALTEAVGLFALLVVFLILYA